MSGVWASFATLVPGEAVKVVSDLGTVIALIGGVGIATGLALFVRRMLKGG